MSGTQDWQYVFSIVGYAESLEFGIGIGPIIETVGGARVVAGTDAGTSYGQPQSVRPDQFGQQFLARARFHLIQQIAGCVGKGAAETENTLKGLGRVDFKAGFRGA